MNISYYMAIILTNLENYKFSSRCIHFADFGDTLRKEDNEMFFF